MFNISGFEIVYGDHKSPVATLDKVFINHIHKLLDKEKQIRFKSTLIAEIAETYMKTFEAWDDNKLDNNTITNLVSRIQDPSVQETLRSSTLQFQVSTLKEYTRIEVFKTPRQQSLYFFVKHEESSVRRCTWWEFYEAHKQNFAPLRLIHNNGESYAKVNTKANPKNPFLQIFLPTINPSKELNSKGMRFSLPFVSQSAESIVVLWYDLIHGKLEYNTRLKFEPEGWTSIPMINESVPFSKEDVLFILEGLYDGTSELLEFVYKKIEIGDGIVLIKKRSKEADGIFMNQNFEVLAVLASSTKQPIIDVGTTRLIPLDGANVDSIKTIERYMLACCMTSSLIEYLEGDAACEM